MKLTDENIGQWYKWLYKTTDPSYMLYYRYMGIIDKVSIQIEGSISRGGGLNDNTYTSRHTFSSESVKVEESEVREFYLKHGHRWEFEIKYEIY